LNSSFLVVANQYKKDRKLFEKTARHWANVYANGKSMSSVYSKSYQFKFVYFSGPTSEPECDKAVSGLVEMGFDAVRTFLLFTFDSLTFFL